VSSSLYSLRQVVQSYAGQTVLRLESLDIEEGSITGLVGPNGSGKSTLLRLLAFVEKPVSGSVRFDGRPGEPFSETVRFQATLLTQEPYLLKRTVLENVGYGLMLRGEARGWTRRAQEALEWVGLSHGEFGKRRWYELSGGEAQRVALAARLVLHPRVLLLDEPTASVDVASAHLIRDAALRARREWGTTLVIASHDWSWLQEICDEVFHVFRGTLVGRGFFNFLFGPWREAGPGRRAKELKDGQRIVVLHPQGPGDAAVLSPGDVSVALDPPESRDGRNRLSCTLWRMSLEKDTGGVLAVLSAGELTFTARLPRDRRDAVPLYPGARVWVSFEEGAVRWL